MPPETIRIGWGTTVGSGGINMEAHWLPERDDSPAHPDTIRLAKALIELGDMKDRCAAQERQIAELREYAVAMERLCDQQGCDLADAQEAKSDV